MRLVFSERAWEDYIHWQAHDPKLVERINAPIKECNPDAVCRDRQARPLSGWWSRRITREHRLVYRVSEDALSVAQCRYHY